jgi:15-cis-phytoene synthase
LRVSLLDESMVNRAAPPGSMRYFSLLYTPAQRRDAVCALYIVDAEIRESALSVNHDVAHTRLQWWRAEVDRLINGNPLHPATRILNDAHAHDRTAFGKLHEALAAADMDLARMTYTNAKELRAYCSRSGGAIAELIASQLVAPQLLDETQRIAANRIGVSVRQSEILRDVRQDAYAGRIYLPQDQLDKHSVTLEDLRSHERVARLQTVLKEFRDAVDAELEPSVARLDTRLRSLSVLSALHRELLRRIAARNFDVATERIELGPIEKPWIAWRAARRAR